MHVVPDQALRQAPGARVEQKLVGIEAQAVDRLIGAMHAIAVVLAWHDVAEMTVPDILAALRQPDARELAFPRLVEQTKLDAFRVRGEQREVGSAPIEASAQRMRCAGQKPHFTAPARRRWTAAGPHPDRVAKPGRADRIDRCRTRLVLWAC